MGKKRNGEIKKCIACYKDFYVPSYRKNTAKFCSLYCQNHKQYERSKFECKECRKKFCDSPCRKGKRVYCSVECLHSFEDKKKIDIRERRRLAIAKNRTKYGNKSANFIRKIVFSEKGKECEICGYHEYDSCLDVHHIDGNPSNNCLENLSVLCVMCHRKIHRKILTIGDKPLDIKNRRSQ